MKKFFALMLTLLLIPCCSGCSLEYGDIETVSDGVRYYKSSMRRQCFAADCEWDGDKENTVINIPDECDGYSVTALGGYIGRGLPILFNITLSDRFEYVDSYPESVTPVQVVFTLNIGKNVKEINRVLLDEEYYLNVDTGEYIQLVFNVNCNKDNKYFYSTDGRLYSRKDNSLIENFCYCSDEDTV